MGFTLREERRFSSLVKKTNKHLIVVKFDFRKRLDEKPVHALQTMDSELRKQLMPLSFTEFLRKNNLVPPGMNMPSEMDEREMEKEWRESMRDPTEDLLDHPEDITEFHVHLVNPRNEGLVFFC